LRVQHLNQFAPSTLQRSIDLAEIENMPLKLLGSGNALVLDNAPVAVLIAVLLANRSA
jgi:hypothetical protein